MSLVNNLSIIPAAPSVPTDDKCKVFLKEEWAFYNLAPPAGKSVN